LSKSLPLAPAALALSGLALLASLGPAELPLALAQPQESSKPALTRLFEGRCQSCHTVPDARLPTDRAWIDQVMETS